MKKHKRSKRINSLPYLRQLLLVIGFFNLGLILNPQQVSARSLTPVEASVEVTLSPLEQNAEKLKVLDKDVQEKQEAVDSQHSTVNKLKEELKSIKDEKLALEKEIEIIKAEIEELKIQKAAKEAREARQAEITRQQSRYTPKPTPVQSSRTYFDSSNTYTYGYCTWYVKNMRGSTLPNGLGNANTWYSRAASMGMAVGSTPKAGAVGTTTRGALGHVVYVHSVNSDGTINISDMNYQGWGQVTYRTVPASEFLYIY